jgi:hypothetical protein
MNGTLAEVTVLQKSIDGHMCPFLSRLVTFKVGQPWQSMTFSVKNERR